MNEYNRKKIIEVGHEEGLDNIREVIGGNYRKQRIGGNIVLDAGSIKYVIRLNSPENDQ